MDSKIIAKLDGLDSRDRSAASAALAYLRTTDGLQAGVTTLVASETFDGLHALDLLQRQTSGYYGIEHYEVQGDQEVYVGVNVVLTPQAVNLSRQMRS